MNEPIQYEARRQVWESNAEKASAALKSFNETQFSVLEARVGFFEKLALFNTGTIAATITMAGSLRQHETLHWKYSLFSGWLFLLIAMGLCLFRNWNTDSHRFYGSIANYNRKNAESIAASAAFQAAYPGALLDELGNVRSKEEYIEESGVIAEEFRQSAQKSEAKSSRGYELLIFSGNTAIVFTFLGVILILVFTIRSLR